MFRIDDWSNLAKACLWPALLVFCAIIIYYPPLEPIGYFRAASVSVTIAVGAVYIYGTWLWRLLWKWLPQCNRWFFPDLNGRWKGEVTSNWPLVKKVLPQNLDEEESQLSKHPITMDIKQTMFGIHLSMNADNEYSSSETIVVVPYKDKVSGEFVLYELYRSSILTPEETDHSSHFGAGVLKFRFNGSQNIIQGHYWTDRQWRQGLNTAGAIQVHRQA